MLPMNLLRTVFALALVTLALPATALALPPGASTGEATNVTFTSATLNGAVNPNKEDTTYYFEYGTAPGTYTARTPDQFASGNAGKAAEADITGLTASTVYYFRLVATNKDGTDQGAEKTFTTSGSPYTLPPPAPAGITCLATPRVVVFGRTSVISGQLAPPNNTGVQVQLQQNPFPFTGGFKNVGALFPSDAAGKVAAPVKPGLHTRYLYVAKTSPPIACAAVEVLVRYRVGFSVDDTSVRRGQLVRFYGTVTPAHNARTVRIQRRTSKGYRTIARTTLRATTGGRSKYSRRIRVYRRGTYRVRMPADADHANGTSRTRTIRVP